MVALSKPPIGFVKFYSNLTSQNNWYNSLVSYKLVYLVLYLKINFSVDDT